MTVVVPRLIHPIPDLLKRLVENVDFFTTHRTLNDFFFHDFTLLPANNYLRAGNRGRT